MHINSLIIERWQETNQGRNKPDQETNPEINQTRNKPDQETNQKQTRPETNKPACLSKKIVVGYGK